MDFLLPRKYLMIFRVNSFHSSLGIQLRAKMKQEDLERSEGDIEEIPQMEFQSLP
jgi:hypothetical protein